MVSFVEIDQKMLCYCVQTAFQGDQDLLFTYHRISPASTFSKCVDDTVSQIQEVAEHNDLTYYALYIGLTMAGFTVVGQKILLSFGINHHYRSKEIVSSWWKSVCKMLGNEFVTWIFKKNTRVVDFLLRNGMEVADDDPKKIFYNLTYVLCPQEV